jgi:hypothetical protein
VTPLPAFRRKVAAAESRSRASESKP